MDKKAYLTSLFEEYLLTNQQKLRNFLEKENEVVNMLVSLIPYAICGNFSFIPGFDKNINSLSIYQFQTDDKLRSNIRSYLNVKEVLPIGTKLNSEIVSIHLYIDLLVKNLNFFVFVNQNLITTEQYKFLKTKTAIIEDWVLNRFKISISIDIFSAEETKIFYLKSSLPINVFDFYLKSIYLQGKYTFSFLIAQNITDKQYAENIKLLEEHKWLNKEAFFDLSFINFSKKEIISLLSHYFKNILSLNFENFHKILLYHSLNQIQNISSVYEKKTENQFKYELGIINQYVKHDFKELMFIQFIFLEKFDLNDYKKEYLKKCFSEYESLDFLSNSLKLKDIYNANNKLKLFLNLLISVYNFEDKAINYLLSNSKYTINFDNFLKINLNADDVLIKSFDKKKWGIYEIQIKNKFQSLEEIFTSNSLFKIILTSIYNGYFDKIIPQIQTNERNLIDENNNFNKLKTKLLKSNINFSYQSFLKNIDSKKPKLKEISLYLNFSQTGAVSYYKDYTYISENWDPLNYGYMKKSGIVDLVLIAKDSFEKLYYFEYLSDESIILAIKDLFSNDFEFNEFVDISISIFGQELSASIIFRLKKLLLTAYEIFSNQNSLFLTSFNGTVYLLVKDITNIEFVVYTSKDDFFDFLQGEDSTTHYFIDEDVIDLSYFSKISKSVKHSVIQLYYFIHIYGNVLYIFDEENQFYFIKNFSLSLLSDIVTLALNHIKQSDNLLDMELYSVESKELNNYEIVQMDINRFKEVDLINSDFKTTVEGVKSGKDVYFNYKVNNKQFLYTELGQKSFWEFLKFVGFSNLDNIRFINLKTIYVKNGNKLKNFKSKLIIYDELKKLLNGVKEKWVK